MRDTIIQAIDGYRSLMARLSYAFLWLVSGVLLILALVAVQELGFYLWHGRLLDRAGVEADAELTARRGLPGPPTRSGSAAPIPIYELQWRDNQGQFRKSSISPSPRFVARLTAEHRTRVRIRYVPSDVSVQPRLIEDEDRLSELLSHLAWGVVGAVGSFSLLRYQKRRRLRSVAGWSPSDPPLDTSLDLTAEEWASLRRTPDERFLRELYNRPAARNQVADAVAQGPAATFEEFKSQVARLQARADST